MNNFDYIVIAIILISTLFGFFSGFIRTVFSLFGWTVAAIGSVLSIPLVSPHLEHVIHNEMLRALAISSSVFIVLALIMALFNIMVLGLFTAIRGGVIDRTLGTLFGIFRGYGFVLVIFTCFLLLQPLLTASRPAMDDEELVEKVEKMEISDDKLKWLRKSYSYQYLKPGYDYLLLFIPEDFRFDIIRKPKANHDLFRENYELLLKIATLNEQDPDFDQKKLMLEIEHSKSGSISVHEKEMLMRKIIKDFERNVESGIAKMPNDPEFRKQFNDLRQDLN